MTNEDLDENIEQIFNKSKKVGKEFYKLDRECLIKAMSAEGLESVPKSMNNIVYVANELYVKNKKISEMVPDKIKQALETYYLHVENE